MSKWAQEMTTVQCYLGLREPWEGEGRLVGTKGMAISKTLVVLDPIRVSERIIVRFSPHLQRRTVLLLVSVQHPKRKQFKRQGICLRHSMLRKS